MALLKKIKASTLMETMVATVLIIVIFMMSSLILNSTFSSQIKANTQPISEHLHKLEYEYKNGFITTPYFEEWDEWTIEIILENKGTTDFVVLQATNPQTGRKIESHITKEIVD